MGPQAENMEYALWFNFPATNNKDEYEAMIIELRAENENVGQLSRLATTYYTELSEEVYVEVCDQPAYEEVVVKNITSSNPMDWRTPIIEYLVHGHLPSDSLEAKKVHNRSFKYQIYQGKLYRKCWDGPLLTCVATEVAPKVLAEVQQGWCGIHIGARSLAIKITRAGYNWPTVVKDATAYVKRCDVCQLMGNAPQLPTSALTPVVSPIPFAMWGIDLVGKLPKAKGGAEFAIITVDYFNKWVEAVPLKKTKSENVIHFLGKTSSHLGSP
ncbi:hypothetical protein LIER_00557 [Lithospermum erythrorhizon]|uniref:Integrase catalytic domain-containing protein n=1 Tax=Lithospermum erythrorhizon TaxID=34254 RepID=A0AAV3NIL4_LITER